MPQDAIDYVLSSGSGFEDGKRRIYQQFLKQEGTEANVQFLRREYGIGGHSDAVPGTDYWLEYDAKGFTSANCMMTAARQLICPGILLRSALVS